MPNITGLKNAVAADNSTCSGALYSPPTPSHFAFNLNANVRFVELYFDASRSNPIYNSSDTVTPLSLTTKFLISY